jgi:hypothetical protein
MSTTVTDSGIGLSIVMPCLNEAGSLPECVGKAAAFLEESGIAGEVIVADNGSTDASREVAAAHGARVVPVTDRGYGAALRGGIAAARGDDIIMGDADATYDFAALAPFVAKLREGHDLVLGNRYAGGIAPGAMPFLHRYLGNPVLSLLARCFFKAPFRDVYCGLRGFKKRAAQTMDLQSRGMEFALEMVVKASLLRMRLAEVPTTLGPARSDRVSHLQTWRDGRRSLKFYLLCSPRWVFLYPGLALVLLGGLLGARILGGPAQVGRASLDVHTLLYCAASVLIGFQAVFFAVFTKMLAVTMRVLPFDPKLDSVVWRIRIEHGLLLGGVLAGLGLLGSLQAFALWKETSFGALDPFVMMRRLIPAVFSIALGLQVVFSSVYLSMLKVKYPEAAIPPGKERDNP